MKIYKHLSLFIILSISLLLGGCKDLTNGYSTDPVNITDPTSIASSKYLTGLQVNLIGAYESDMARATGMWTGYFSGEDRQYKSLGQYTTSGADYDVEWITIYTGIFTNSNILKSKARKEVNLKTVGIAQLMEAMALGLAADLWGDVPYTDASKFPIVTTPKFDDQSSVYAAVQIKLDSAILNFGLLGGGDGDIFFNGDVSQYILTAHTLKARYYLHVRDYTNAIAEANKGIKNASSDMLATHGSAYLQTFNTYYSFMSYDRSGYLGANSYCPKLLDSKVAGNRNHPGVTDETARLNYYYIPKGGANFSSGSITYEPNVLYTADFGNPANLNGFFAATASFPLVSFAENQLILSESLLKTGDFDGALAALNILRAYYKTGANLGTGYANQAKYTFAYEPYKAADFNALGIENPDGIDSHKALLREILEEKYVSLIGQIEGFNDMRRTGNFLNLPIAAGQPSYPKRVLYPQIEINTNLGNIPSSGVGLFDPVKAFSTPY